MTRRTLLAILMGVAFSSCLGMRRYSPDPFDPADTLCYGCPPDAGSSSEK